MMFDNTKYIDEITDKLPEVLSILDDKLVYKPYYENFSYQFCWSSNHLEGNTLTLEETVQLIDFDEVKAGHKYSEYEEAKRLFSAISLLDPQGKIITEDWLKEVNQRILQSSEAGYRCENVYIANKIDAVYYPPDFSRVTELMSGFAQTFNTVYDKKEALTELAKRHIEFEHIHPFIDGNGRTGRMLLNQQLINNGFLPVNISSTSKYRRAFREFRNKQDISAMVYLICKAELAEMENVYSYVKAKERGLHAEDPLVFKGLIEKLNRDISERQTEEIDEPEL